MDVEMGSGGLVWWGPAEGGLGWLRQRVRELCHSRSIGNRDFWQVEFDDSSGLFELVELGVHRIVVACECRWDYPQPAIQRLTTMFPDIPVAIAMSDWWLGWRRTGIGHGTAMPLVALPWFRWWDGWVPWFLGTAPGMLGPFPSNIPLMTEVVLAHGTDLTLSGSDEKAARWNSHHLKEVGPAMRVLIVGGCLQAMQSWQDVLGGKKTTTRLCGFGLSHPSAKSILDAEKPDWVLWDDSRVTTVPGWPAAKEDGRTAAAVEELTCLANRFPESRLLVAWTVPTWNVVRQLQEAGLRFELLAKPYFGSFSSAALGRT